ncbi:uncharacterized protein LOC117329406 [Pecten maximus]|uniref:uncharacterized protein LOC117329406 n=1 Tax=Pecten maximus TaxID=6579 RepID=UPI00145838C2|nr:uncharacterized protein LOC117329406 [Pecten maximus]
MVNKTKVARMKERERIASLLKTAVLSLCQEKYKNPIEVDALICVALTPTDNHVVKIHETLGHFENKTSELLSSQDANGDQNICKVTDIWSMGPKSKRKRKNTTELNKLIRMQGGGDLSAWQADESAEKLSDISITASGSEGLKNDTSVKKYPYLVQTLCGEDNMYLSSVSKDVLKKDVENPVTPTQPKEPASVASILSGLMIPMSTASTPVPPIPAAESLNIQASETSIRRKRKLDRGEIRRASPVTQDDDNDSESTDYTSIKEKSEDSLYNQKPSDKEQESSVNNDESSSNQTMSETLPGGIVIKEEPLWSPNEDTESKWQTENEEENNSEVENSQTSSTCNTPTHFYQSQPESTESLMEMSVTSVKEEPQDSDPGEPVMEIDTDIDSSQLDQSRNCDSGLISETTKNSILLKILKGKSLAEAYKSSVPTERLSGGNSNGTSASVSQQNTGEDQDNSLVYRLPFVSFQDLFPGDVSGEKSQERENVSVTSPHETSMRVGSALTPTEHANRKFELLTRTLLEKRNRVKGPYSTRLSSGRKNPVNYTEMADVGSDFDGSDDSSSRRSELDDSYSPRLQGMLDEDEEKSSRRRKKGYNRPPSEFSAYKQNTTNMKYNMESDTNLKYEKTNDQRSSSSPSSITCPPNKSSSNLLLFACSICGSEFSSRAERDRHEEEEQYSEFVKCPLCNGYFGDEMSKRKHMRERHKVCEKELNFKSTGSGSSGELRALEVPKFSEGMLTYHTTQCPMCYNFFYSEAERDEHLNKEHNVTPVTQ